MLGRLAAAVVAADDGPFDVEVQERSDDVDCRRDSDDELQQPNHSPMRPMDLSLKLS